MSLKERKDRQFILFPCIFPASVLQQGQEILLLSKERARKKTGIQVQESVDMTRKVQEKTLA